MNTQNCSDIAISNLIVIGLSHKTAPVETRELLCLPESQVKAFYDRLSDAGICESVYVSTCNRVEVYMVAHDRESAVETIKKLMEFYTRLSHESFMSSVYTFYGYDAARHLFSVTSSLDSMVIGENEITGQVKESYRRACEYKSTGVILNKLFHRAFAAAKRVKAETEISKNPLSMASIAVDKSKDIFPDLSARSALLIGAGEMGELILKYLVKEQLQKIIIANRTIENAQRICREINYEAIIIPLVKVDKALSEVDIVISSVTAPHHIINERDTRELMFERNNKPLVIIDIAVPRNVEPSVKDIDGVYLYNVDSLREIAERNKKQREIELEKAKNIVEEEISSFELWFDEYTLAPTIAALKNSFESIRHNELKKFRNKKMKHFSDEDFALVVELTEAIMNKTLHNPIMNLKKMKGCSDEKGVQENVKFLEDIFNKC
ncbi:MAG TPA: glutamyl-tRNA reductase [Spirochaetota bacterium]|nr:glutamyl-tRNA reductase [Spirochaetota bacterium]